MSLSDEAKCKIKREYFLPFIESIKKLQLNEKKEISAAMNKLQEEWSAIAIKLRTADSSLKSIQTSTFYSPFLKKLANLYLNEKLITEECPGCTLAGVQTYIRTLFHSSLNPKELEFIQIDTLKSELLTRDEFKTTIKHSSRLFSEKKELNIFYMLGHEIKITKPRKFSGFDDDEICLNHKLSACETAKSFANIDENETVKLFSSLYEAIEYAFAKQHGGHLFETEREGFMSSIWAVCLIADSDNLNSKQEIVIANKGKIDKRYGGERHIEVSYAETAKHKITPIIGTMLYPNGGFASYQIINQVKAEEIEKWLSQPDNNQSKETDCLLSEENTNKQCLMM